MPKVLVSGCFDLLHPGHIAFLKQAAAYGDLHVSVGSDVNIELLKKQRPLFSEDERAYVLSSIACVRSAAVSCGIGHLDFVEELTKVQPDVFVVNQDGDSVAKRSACEKRGVKYVVLERIPANDFPPQSSTACKKQVGLPYRVCIAGG